MPIFSSTPARMTEPAVGASTCASGSQVWNGNSGTLIANASANARKTHFSNRAAQRQPVEVEQVEARAAVGARCAAHGQPDDGDEHQHAAGHRVEDELDRGVDAALVAPDPDEEVHRDQHRVPEHVEQEQVDRDEHAEHRGLEREDEERERLHVLVHRFPRRQQRERRQEAGQDDQQQADAVDADVVLDAEVGHPRVPLVELERRRWPGRSATTGSSVAAKVTSEAAARCCGRAARGRAGRRARRRAAPAARRPAARKTMRESSIVSAEQVIRRESRPRRRTAQTRRCGPSRSGCGAARCCRR